MNEKKGKKVEVEVPINFDKTSMRVKRFGFHQFRHSSSNSLITKKNSTQSRRRPRCVRATWRSLKISTRKPTTKSFWPRRT